MPELVPGSMLGQYRILERIGKGGMATVYKAYQAALDRYVAIKVLPAILVQEDGFLARFTQEARAIARLRHPNILTVFDFGEAQGLAYIVMEYVEGGTLKQCLGQPLDLDMALQVVRQVGAALEYAHSQGVLHRDVKPSNVLMGKGDWLLLSDFGLAKMAEGSLALTKTGVGVGTPEYMAPEQAEGLSYDHRVDIYALGVVLYEMVTGRLPYEAETPIGVIMKKLTAPLPLPRALNSALPEGVERVILKALARDPADRYARVDGMVKALEAAVAGAAPVEAARPAPAPAPPPLVAPPPPTEAVPALPVVAWPAVPRRYLRSAALLAGLAVVLLCLGGGILALRPKLPDLLAVFQAPATRPVASQGKIAFASNRDGNDEIYVMNADGTSVTRLTVNLAGDYNPTWSPQ